MVILNVPNQTRLCVKHVLVMITTKFYFHAIVHYLGQSITWYDNKYDFDFLYWICLQNLEHCNSSFVGLYRPTQDLSHNQDSHSFVQADELAG